MFWSRKKIKELDSRIDYLNLRLERAEFELKNPRPFKIGYVKTGKYKGMTITGVDVCKEYKYTWHSGVYRWKVSYIDKAGITYNEWA